MSDYKEFFEEYKDMLAKYCLAAVDMPIHKNEDGYYLGEELRERLYVLGGHFDNHYVVDEIQQGDFPFEGVDKEGHWHIEMLFKYIKGDYEEPSYLELLLSEATFYISFEDQIKIDEKYVGDIFDF